jgi:SAM-dependent methyltransferase
VERPSWAPDEVDLDRPSVARVYDYYLGGSHNFPVDREMARGVLLAMPDVPRLAQDNRAFLRRAVRWLAREGIDQFVDLGSGIPTVGNVHEVAREVDADARVVYVDWDPVAVAHSRAILAGDERTAVIGADLRDPDRVFGDPALRALVDLDRPVAILLVAVLHFLHDDDRPDELIRTLAAAVAPGSYVVVSHASPAGRADELAEAAEFYERSNSSVRTRTREEITKLFGELALVHPGVVRTPLWRPESAVDAGPDAEHYPGFAGVARVG